MNAPPAEIAGNVQEALSGCWLWTGTLNASGYPVCSTKLHPAAAAHRWAYEHTNGPIPHGLQIDHLCRVKHCVNPAHLEAVTPAENNRRARPFRSSPPAGTAPIRDGKLRVSEVGRLLGVSAETVRMWADNGRLPYERTPGGHRKFRQEDVDALREEVAS